ncbi:hypothetical protein UFOVP1419_18 [uncultured Caudovirales phage]|uniref:Uncharacterized protein n=1 Tax=uncultured Caudovirales phage TaxID=2100421 RepID=A0A6J5SD48_9CAUD|nr:hypothetical protein UFOVP1419_18 [uncultured Caudovirales phage]
MNKHEMRYAVLVCLLVVLAMGFAGWYENHDVVPQPSLREMAQQVDRALAPDRSVLVQR